MAVDDAKVNSGRRLMLDLGSKVPNRGPSRSPRWIHERRAFLTRTSRRWSPVSPTIRRLAVDILDVFARVVDAGNGDVTKARCCPWIARYCIVQWIYSGSSSPIRLRLEFCGFCVLNPRMCQAC
jgi:hypothetical protein